MIFKQYYDVLEETKTQTRRVVKPGEDTLTTVYADGRNQINAVTLRPRVGMWTERKGRIYDDLSPFEEGTGTLLPCKWRVGRTYAVVPRRGRPTLWWRELESGDRGIFLGKEQKDYEWLKEHGYQPLRIRITAIRKEPLQAITEEDAKAEGVNSIEEYKMLWNSINGNKKGMNWSSNPEVWVLTFEVVKE